MTHYLKNKNNLEFLFIIKKFNNFYWYDNVWIDDDNIKFIYTNNKLNLNPIEYSLKSIDQT